MDRRRYQDMRVRREHAVKAGWPLYDCIKGLLISNKKTNNKEIAERLGIGINVVRDLVARNAKWLFITESGSIQGFTAATGTMMSQLKKEVLDMGFEAGEVFKESVFAVTEDKVLLFRNEEIFKSLGEVVEGDAGSGLQRFRIVRNNEQNKEYLQGCGLQNYAEVSDYRRLKAFGRLWIDVGDSQGFIRNESVKALEILRDLGLEGCYFRGRFSFRLEDLERFVNYCGGSMADD